jgi:hypothetical protein
MYGAIARGLIPEDDERCEAFDGMDQDTTLLAIADLAWMLIADTGWVKGNSADWEKLVGMVTDDIYLQICGRRIVKSSSIVPGE